MKVPLSDAKANLSALVARAAAGERIIITVRGKPVAALDRVMMPMDAAMETPYTPKPPGAPGLSLADLLKASREPS